MKLTEDNVYVEDYSQGEFDVEFRFSPMTKEEANQLKQQILSNQEIVERLKGALKKQYVFEAEWFIKASELQSILGEHK